MNQVDPIKYKEEIHQMYKVYEHGHKGIICFKFAIHTGIKLTDLLNMKVKYLKTSGNIKHLDDR